METVASRPDLSTERPTREAASSLVLLRPISASLAVLYLILTLVHPLAVPDIGLVLAGFSGLSALVLGLIAWFARRVTLGWANAALTAVLLVSVGNSALHLLLSREIWQITNLMLVIIGAGMALVSLRWNLFIVIACWLPTGFAAFSFGGSTTQHWIISMLLATFAGQLARYARAKGLASAAQAMADVDAISTHDELTGLLNRRGIIRQTEQFLQQASDNRQHSTVYLIDVAGLRECGERFGQDAVDDAISRAGRAIAASAPKGAVVGRWNWDHFLIVAAGQAPSAEQMNSRISAILAADQNGNPVLWSPDISVGDAIAKPGTNSDVTELLWRADHELYASKRGWRVPPEPAYPPITKDDFASGW